MTLHPCEVSTRVKNCHYSETYDTLYERSRASQETVKVRVSLEISLSELPSLVAASCHDKKLTRGQKTDRKRVFKAILN